MQLKVYDRATLDLLVSARVKEVRPNSSYTSLFVLPGKAHDKLMGLVHGPDPARRSVRVQPKLLVKVTGSNGTFVHIDDALVSPKTDYRWEHDDMGQRFISGVYNFRMKPRVVQSKLTRDDYWFFNRYLGKICHPGRN